MGLKNCAVFLHTIKNLHLSQLLSIARWKTERSSNFVGHRSVLRIDIDCSWVVRRKGCCDVSSSVALLICFAVAIANHGVAVMLVCDGSVRHHSKRATVQRRSKTQRDKLELIVGKSELVQLSKQRRCTDSIEEQHNIEQLQQKIQSRIKTLEKNINSSNVDVGDGLYNVLVEELDRLTMDDIINGGSVEACQAVYQADSVMAQRMVNNQTDILLTADSDQAALLGKDCICIKNYTFVQVEKKIHEIELFFANKTVMNEIANCIGLPGDAECIVSAKYPIFDDIVCPVLRGLMAVALGCDVNLFSIVTPKQIFDYVSGNAHYRTLLLNNNENKNEDAYLAFKEFVMSQYNQKMKKKVQSNNIRKKRDIVSDVPVVDNKFREMLDVFVDAFVYEPANIAGCTNNSNRTTINNSNSTITNTYIHFPPTKRLHPYITTFDVQCYENNVVDCCNDVVMCEGTGNGTHLVMVAEGYCFCSTCNKVVCKECVCQRQNVDKMYCYECFLPEISVRCEDNNNNHQQQEPMIEIREHLRNKGITTNMTDNDGEVLDIYDAINKQSPSLLSGQLLHTKISIPQHSATYLEELQKHYVSSFDMLNGGRFVVDSRLRKEDVFQIINIMAKLVNITKKENIESYKKNTYQMIPSILIDFAEGARVHSGYRLLKRCIRHAIDPQTYSILHARGYIVRHGNQAAITVHHRMKASMKNATYNVSVCFNSDTIIACQCNCKAGCFGDGRVVCVHVLPVLYQITMLMFDGLAESLLVELSHHWRRLNENEISEQDKNRLKENIILLRSAACTLNNINGEQTNKTIEELLVQYNVGTENAKKMILPPRDNKLLGPLRKENFTSATKIAKSKVQPRTTNNGMQHEGTITANEEDTTINDPIVTVETTTYQSIVKCIHVLTKLCPGSDRQFLKENLGYQVLEHRAFPIRYETTSGNVSTLLSTMKQLLESANNDNREPVSIRTRQEKQHHDTVDLQQHESTSNIHQQSSSTKTNNDCPVVAQKKKYHTCCACTLTNTKQPDSLFTKVPCSGQRPLQPSDNDNVRKTHWRRIFHRKEYLRRLGIKTNDERKGLEICNQHKMEQALVEFPWIDSNKQKQVGTAYLTLPQDPSCKPLEQCKTRQQQHVRKDAPPRRTNNRIYKKTKNHLQQHYTHYRYGRKCDYNGCCNRHADGNLSFISIPKCPSLLSENDRPQYKNYFLMKHDIKQFFFLQNMKRIGSEHNDPRKQIRICNQHPIEKVEMDCEWIDRQSRKRKTCVTMYLPKKQAKLQNNTSCSPTESSKSSSLPEHTRLNKGLAKDRFLQRQLVQVQENNKENECQNAMAMIQMWEESEGLTETINPTVANIAGIGQHRKNIYNKIKIDFPPPSAASNMVVNEYDYLHNSDGKKTKVRLIHLKDKHIKTSTGFPSVVAMLSFVAILCNGNPKEIGERTTKLTWFEEWMVYFEFVWCKSCTRWKDLEAKYDVHNKTLRRIFDRKLAKHLKTINSWPKYLTLFEDEMLQKNEKWSNVYGKSRIVMWDNTDVRMYKPSASDAQRNTYSAYYAGNVAKGGVFIQPSGWMGTYELWVGAVSDSEYMERSGILEDQTKYIKEHDSINSSVPWKIILDKGYRITSAAWRAGGQFVLQPSFAKSDRMFTADETILSSTIASDRSANERAVRYAKLSGYIRKGLLENESPERLNNVWKAWGFQCNFIYKPVL